MYVHPHTLPDNLGLCQATLPHCNACRNNLIKPVSKVGPISPRNGERSDKQCSTVNDLEMFKYGGGVRYTFMVY